MAKTKVEDWDETESNNTEINNIGTLNTSNAANSDDFQREIMAQIAKWTGADTIASASTTDLASVPGKYVTVTGTATITALGTVREGWEKRVLFTGALTLTHNATSLILPGGANIATAAGDTAVFVSAGSGNWRCVSYQKANGSPISMILPQSASPAPTADGEMQWDSDDDAIVVGDGSGQKVFRPGVWELIGTADPSAAATQTFTDLSPYRILRATYYLTPGVDNATLYVQVSTNNGVGYDTTNYAGQRLESFATTIATNTTVGTGFIIARGVGNTTPEAASGVITINEFNQAKQAYALAHVAFLDGTPADEIGTYTGRSTITTARNAIRFLPSGGDITGRIILEGVRG